IVVDYQGCLNFNGLKDSSFFNHDSFFVKRTSKTINYNWNNNWLEFFNNVGCTSSDRFPGFSSTLRKCNYPAIIQCLSNVGNIAHFYLSSDIFTSGPPRSFNRNRTGICQYFWQQT